MGTGHGASHSRETVFPTVHRQSNRRLNNCKGLPPWRVLVPKEPLEPIRRQGGVPRRVLNIPMPEIGLERAGIDPIVCKLKPRRMAQHMGVRLNAEFGCDASPLDHAREARALRTGRPRSLTKTNGDFALSR